MSEEELRHALAVTARTQNRDQERKLRGGAAVIPPLFYFLPILMTAIATILALIPLAARIYEGGILRTGSSLKLREAWHDDEWPR